MRFPKKVVALAGVVVLVAVGLGICWRSENRGAGLFAPRAATLVCPGTVELGEADSGDAVEGRLTIQNAGSLPLEISNIRTSCACIGLQRREGDSWERVIATTIDPRESADFLLKFTAVGAPGQPLRIGMVFSTNDPELPEFGVQMLISRLRAGVTTLPAQILLNGVPSSSPIARRVSVYDSYDPPRSVKRVLLSGFDQSTVTFTPVGPSAPAERHLLGRLIGHIDLVLSLSGPGPIDGSIELETVENPSRVIRVPIGGQAVNLVRIAPDSIVMPVRRSGQWQYSTRCICRPADASGGAMTIEISEMPPALEVTVTHTNGAEPAYLEIGVKPGYRTSKNSEPATYLIKLKGTVGDRVCHLEIPVIVSPLE